MKTLTYIFGVCLIVLASCGGCGSSKSSMGGREIPAYTEDSLAFYRPIETPKPAPKPEPKAIYKDKTDDGVTKEGKTYTENRYSDTIISQITTTTAAEIAPPPPPPNTIQTANGTLVYKVDSVLTIGIVSRVEARIIRRVSASTTNSLVAMTTHTTTGVIKTEIIPVGNIMDMTLTSLNKDAFDIVKVNSGDQPVDASTVTEWLWGVTAQKIGDYNLILKAKVKGVSKDKIVFDKQINVKNKPKIKYSTKFEIPKQLVRYKENIVNFSLTRKNSDTYNIEWGGKGKVEIMFLDLNFSDDVIVTKIDDYEINDEKFLFNYKWTVKPNGEQDSLHYTIKIVGDYEELVIYDKYIKVDKNIKGTLEIFLDGAAKRWYWIFSSLLIPLYMILKKKYFPEKRIFRRKKIPTPKTPPKRNPKI